MTTVEVRLARIQRTLAVVSAAMKGAAEDEQLFHNQAQLVACCRPMLVEAANDAYYTSLVREIQHVPAPDYDERLAADSVKGGAL